MPALCLHVHSSFTARKSFDSNAYVAEVEYWLSCVTFPYLQADLHGQHLIIHIITSLQSGFRPGHSTETVVLRVMSDLLEAVDSGDVAALVLLDLSAAFDTVDHNILCRRLQVTFGLDGPVLAWFHSYLHGRSQCVRHGMYKSPFVQLLCGVPQDYNILAILLGEVQDSWRLQS